MGAYMTSRNGSSELVQVGAVFTISPADMLDDHMPMSSEWVATFAKDSGSVYLGCFPEQTPQQSAMSWSGLHTAITVPHTVRLADSVHVVVESHKTVLHGPVFCHGFSDGSICHRDGPIDADNVAHVYEVPQWLVPSRRIWWSCAMAQMKNSAMFSHRETWCWVPQ